MNHKYILALSVISSHAVAHDFITQGRNAIINKNRQEAIACFTKALEENSKNSDAIFNMAIVEYYSNNGHAALPLFKNCYQSNPKNEQYLFAYASIADHLGYHNLARDIFEEAYGAEPQNGTIRTKLFPMYLRNMDWYYARKLRNVDHIWWYNKDITNNDILLDLSSEWNGRGDVIMITRYAQHLYNAGAHVSIYVRPDMIPLLSHCPFIKNLISSQQPKPSYPIEYSITADTLTLVMRNTLHEPSSDIPYIYADASLEQKWRAIIRNTKNLNVGICWQSVKMKDYFTDTIITSPRSMNPEQFVDLFSIPHCTFYNLQIGEDHIVQQLKTNHSNFISFDTLDKTHGPFSDSAALMKNLDVIITVDTSIAHLAGALGIDTILMLPHASDFRWFSDRSDSPWYPTMKLIRQPRQHEWNSVIELVKKELEQRLKTIKNN